MTQTLMRWACSWKKAQFQHHNTPSQPIRNTYKHVLIGGWMFSDQTHLLKLHRNVQAIAEYCSNILSIPKMFDWG